MAHWGLRPVPPVVHVTIPWTRDAPELEGVRVHRSRRLKEARHSASTLPCTRLEASVLDVAAYASALSNALEILATAVRSRGATAERLRRELALRHRMPRRLALEAALDDLAAGAHSALERQYLHSVERRHGLPPAERQVRHDNGTGVIYRDALYRDQGVIVELDGLLGHADVPGRFRDMHRDNAAAAGGLITLRFGHADVFGQPCGVAGQVVTVLQARGWPGAPRRCGATCKLRLDAAPH